MVLKLTAGHDLWLLRQIWPHFVHGHQDVTCECAMGQQIETQRAIFWQHPMVSLKRAVSQLSFGASLVLRLTAGQMLWLVEKVWSRFGLTCHGHQDVTCECAVGHQIETQRTIFWQHPMVWLKRTVSQLSYGA